MMPASHIKLEIFLPFDPAVWNVVAEIMKMTATIDGEVRQSLHRDMMAGLAIETGDVVGAGVPEPQPVRRGNTRPPINK